MSASTKLTIGKLLMSLVAVFTIISPFLADWNETHIFNQHWPPHAKFHNAQTMTLAVLLGSAALLFLWRRRGVGFELFPTLLFVTFYWISQVPAFAFPGVGWTDPELLQPGQAMSDVPIQLKLDLVLFALISSATWLILQGRDERPVA